MTAGAAVAVGPTGRPRERGPAALTDSGIAHALLVRPHWTGVGPWRVEGGEEIRMQAMTTTGDRGADRVRPPVIFGASPSLLRVFTPEELPQLAEQLPQVNLPRPLRLLTRKVREDWTIDGKGRSVLLEHDDADVAAAVVVDIARTAQVLLIWVSARELVSSELAFPQRAMSGVMRFALRHGHCLVYVHDFDAIAQPKPLYPSHYARRATHDVVSAMSATDARRGDVMLLTSVSPGTLDRSVIIDRFDVAVRLEVCTPATASKDWGADPLTDVA